MPAVPRVPRRGEAMGGACHSGAASRSSSLHASCQPSRDGTSSDTSADEWEPFAACDSAGSDGSTTRHAPAFARPVAVSGACVGGIGLDGALGGGSGGSGGADLGRRTAHHVYGPTRQDAGTPPAEGFLPASMDDRLLEVVAVEGVLQLGLAQMSLTNAIRLCQCSSITITSSSNKRLPLQVGRRDACSHISLCTLYPSPTRRTRATPAALCACMLGVHHHYHQRRGSAPRPLAR